ncbi:hypothetical protein D3C80_2226060 [compost metagenome]
MTSGMTSGAVSMNANPVEPRKRRKRTITTAASVPTITAMVAAAVAIDRLMPTALIIAESWKS